MKYFTIAGKRYTLKSRSYDSHLTLTGPGLVGAIALSTDITFETPNLRERVVRSIENHKECSRKAREYIQEKQRLGLIPGGVR